MGKYVFAYTGGGMAETPAAQEAVMQAWGAWFGGLGDVVIDGGNPFGASTLVKGDGSTGTAKTGLGGYSIVSADSLELAAKLTSGCPIFDAGGAVEVFEAIEM